MKKYRYIEIAPTRHPYDDVYLTFENVQRKKLIYRKGLKGWNNASTWETIPTNYVNPYWIRIANPKG